MLTIDEMISNRATLAALLPKLQSGELQAIEYGPPNEPNGFMSYLRIKWILTAGGSQFRICELYRGNEGSGYYTPEISEIQLKAENLVQHYHRTVQSSALRRQLQERLGNGHGPSDQFDWFPVELPAYVPSEQIDPILPGEVVIELPAPNSKSF